MRVRPDQLATNSLDLQSTSIGQAPSRRGGEAETEGQEQRDVLKHGGETPPPAAVRPRRIMPPHQIDSVYGVVSTIVNMPRNNRARVAESEVVKIDPKLKIERIRVDELVPYAGNAKEHGETDVNAIAASIDQFGMCDPIGAWHDADGNPVIVEGHGRLLALKQLGHEYAPVIFLDHLDDDARRAYTHVHNQTTLNTGFDMSMLGSEIAALPEFDWEAFGFDAWDSFERVNLDEIIQDEVPTDVEPRVKHSEIWALGAHRLMCGDSTKHEDVEKLVGGGLVSLLLTDPPYNVDYHGVAGAIDNDNFSDEGAFRSFLADALSCAFDAMKPGAAFYVWFASVHSPAVYGAVADSGLKAKQELEWIKSQFVLGRQDYQWAHEPCVYGWKDGAGHYFAPIRNEWTVIDDSMNTRKMTKTQLREALENILADGIEQTVLRYAKPTVSELHPTTKPVKLFARLMSNSSREGEAILDLFGGSGTTMISAEQLGRKAYLMELDPHYCDVIIERWERFTGKQAVKADG